jgi:hypothetical protein
MLQDIVGHKTDGHAVARAGMYIKVGSNRQIRKTTKGWHLCVEWKDETTVMLWKWLSMPQPRTYMTSQLFWWVPHILKKRNRIIAAVTKMYHKHTHKFGIQVPKTWDEAVNLDEGNGNTLWKDAIRKEMNNFRIAFKVLNG